MRDMLDRLTVGLNNCAVRLRKPRFQAGEVLLLAPRCIHRTECKMNVESDIAACVMCGQCNVKALAELSREYGVRCRISRGGREAAEYVREEGVKGVVAVACLRELASGIRAVFPKPVIAVPNCLPNGACKDTCVDVAAVRLAVEAMVGPRKGEGTLAAKS